jgi:hypothetical protein
MVETGGRAEHSRQLDLRVHEKRVAMRVRTADS